LKLNSAAQMASEQRIGPCQSRAQIEELLNRTGLDKEMKDAGFWP